MKQGPPHLLPGPMQSHTHLLEIKDTHEIVLFDSIDGFDVGDPCLSSAVDLLLNHSACTGKYIFIESCRTVEFDIFCKSQVHILVLGFFLILLLLVRTFGVLVPILLTIVVIFTLIISFVVPSFEIVIIVSTS